MPSHSPSLDLALDVIALTAAVCDIESVSGDEAPLAGAPEQVFDTTTTVATDDTTDSTDVATGDTAPESTAPVVTVAGPEENVKGIVPDKSVSC